MPRSYRNISHYKKEILELKANGATRREIGEKFGFTKEQVHNFISRYNKRKRKVAALKYVLNRKDAKIKQLEMENKLMRIFSRLLKGSENNSRVPSGIQKQR